jgi:hypothetical protein
LKGSLAAFAVVLLAATPPARAQADLSGEWRVQFSTERMGPQEFTMYVAQNGPRLSGRLTSPSGEFPLRGTAEGDTFTITWSHPVDDTLAVVVFEGTVAGDTLSGTAKVADMKEGALRGERKP